jgi:hypothetical protein
MLPFAICLRTSSCVMTLLNSRIFSNSGPATARSSEPMPNSAAMVEAVLRGGTDYHHRADSALFARATTCFTSFHGGSIDQSCRWGQGKRVRVQGPHRLQYSEGHYQGVAARRRPSIRRASPARPPFNLKIPDRRSSSNGRFVSPRISCEQRVTSTPARLW